MSRRLLIIQGHPDRAPERLCRALAAAYGDGAREAGHVVQILDLAALDFPLLASEAEFTKGEIPPGLQEAAKLIREADHLCLVFPLWLGTMPALVKAFLEQVMRPGTAFAPAEGGGFPRKLLGGRSARVVVTMGAPAFVYRWWYGGFGVRGLKRSILGFVGFAPVRITLLGMVGSASATKRAAWLRRMRESGRLAR